MLRVSEDYPHEHFGNANPDSALHGSNSDSRLTAARNQPLEYDESVRRELSEIGHFREIVACGGVGWMRCRSLFVRRGTKDVFGASPPGKRRFALGVVGCRASTCE
jgi:hypothetical protein